MTTRALPHRKTTAWGLLALRAAPQAADEDVPLRTYRNVRALLFALRISPTLCAVVSIATRNEPWFHACFQVASSARARPRAMPRKRELASSLVERCLVAS